ncbi:hypothetical protein [Wolbachia endosymbiont of Tribolium confusum]|uniref:hypothetical protein n=1 Tax=Wolbachia endosymbiont of Tribolium confusum TaxID=214474 RepID=UPI001CF3D1DF|nr:hypothetical protein [Wolbachia endosymbiont of Tribolium confusum]MCA7010700.1 hypothetical protein [Wolbachia endosymbiont of Tribolium confusum]
MPDFEFSDLQDLVNALYDSYYLPSNGKIKLAELLEDVLELEGKKSPEEAIATLKDKIRNELKNEMRSEMKQKINKFKQLENENIELKAEKNKLNTQIQQLQQEKKILETKNEATGQLRKKTTYIATASTCFAVGLVVYTALEHTTKLDIWLMVSIAVVPALIATSLTYLALKPSSQVSETQEPQGVANKNSVA